MTSQLEGGTPADEPYKKIICTNLNLLLGAQGFEDAAHTYWTHEVKRELKQQFLVRAGCSVVSCAVVMLTKRKCRCC